MNSKTIAIFMGLIVTSPVLAQEHPEHPKKQATQAKVSEVAQVRVVEATLVGENICLGCLLKKTSDAAAQCDTNGHKHVLKVTNATTKGGDAPEMKGWVLHYLDNDKAQPYIKEHHGETVTIKGRIYPDERVFEVGNLTEAKKSEHPEHPEHPKKTK